MNSSNRSIAFRAGLVSHRAARKTQSSQLLGPARQKHGDSPRVFAKNFPSIPGSVTMKLGTNGRNGPPPNKAQGEYNDPLLQQLQALHNQRVRRHQRRSSGSRFEE